MKNNVTEMVFIIDKSGSMAGFERDTLDGFNSMIERQREVEGNAYVSTVMFSDNSVIIHDRVDIRKIVPLTENDYRVGGCTALLDAIGSAIHHIGNVHKYACSKDVPEHTVFVITTDGMENSSHMYSAKQIKDKIKRQTEKYGWEFIFLAANINAVETADRMGIRRERAMDYIQSHEGVKCSYRVMADAVCCMRTDPAVFKNIDIKRIGENKNERVEDMGNP